MSLVSRRCSPSQKRSHTLMEWPKLWIIFIFFSPTCQSASKLSSTCMIQLRGTLTRKFRTVRADPGASCLLAAWRNIGPFAAWRGGQSVCSLVAWREEPPCESWVLETRSGQLSQYLRGWSENCKWPAVAVACQPKPRLRTTRTNRPWILTDKINFHDILECDKIWFRDSK